MQQTISEEFAASLVGQETDVLVDGVNEDGWLFGRTQYDAPGGQLDRELKVASVVLLTA